MPWNQNFRYNLHCKHTFWHLKLKTKDFSKFLKQYTMHFSNNCMHTPDTVDKNMLYFYCVTVTQCFSLSLITHKLKTNNQTFQNTIYLSEIFVSKSLIFRPFENKPHNSRIKKPSKPMCKLLLVIAPGLRY